MLTNTCISGFTVFVHGVSFDHLVREADPSELSVGIPEHLRRVAVDGGLVESGQPPALGSAQPVGPREVHHFLDQLDARVALSMVLEPLGLDCSGKTDVRPCPNVNR